MSLTLKQRAEKLFNNYEVPDNVKERYKRDWLRSVAILGERWLFAQHAQRLTPEQQRDRSEDGTYRIKTRATDDSPRT